MKCKLVIRMDSLGLSGGLGSVSVPVLLPSVDVSEMSQSSSSSSVSTDGFDRPGVSSLGSSSSKGSGLSLLEMEV